MRCFALGFAAVLVAACNRQASGPTPGEELGARLSVWSADSSATITHEGWLPTNCRRVVADDPAWRELWRTAFEGYYIPTPPLPQVDFDSGLVLVVSLGVYPTPSVAVTIDSVVRFDVGDRVYVSKRLCPSPLQIAATPIHMVRSPRFVIVSWRTADGPCLYQGATRRSN